MEMMKAIVVDAPGTPEVLVCREVDGVSIQPDNVFRLEEVAEAHRLIESSRNFGKSVVLLD